MKGRYIRDNIRSHLSVKNLAEEAYNLNCSFKTSLNIDPV
jgi:hypothetical protein